MLVVHENEGLNDWVRSVAGRLAGACHSARAIDLLAAEGGTGAFQDPAQAAAALGVTASPGAAKAALDRAGLVREIVVEPNADHAFFNDTGPRYNAGASADAWQRLLDWFGRISPRNDRKSRCWPGVCRILGDVSLQRDTPEESAADRADRLLTRREAIRRLALVGVTAGPTALVAACSSGRGGWPSRRRRRRR